MMHRSGWPRLFLVLLLLGLPLSAGAQPALPQTVTVKGQGVLPAQTVDRFVKTVTVPTFFLGKLARWKDDICPEVSGENPQAAAFIQQRILAVAAMVRIDPDTRTPCPVNLEIVFTPTPQTFMDDIRKTRPNLLGFQDDKEFKTGQRAIMIRPIQAWYVTRIRDHAGQAQSEQNYRNCLQKRGGVLVPFALVSPKGLYQKQGLDDLNRNAALCGSAGKSSPGANGISNDFSHVLIVADNSKLAGIPVASLADYIAMLAMAQSQPSDACQELPTIANLLAPGCGAAGKPEAMTDVDVAYLKALYATDPEENLAFQQGDIASRMKRALNHP